MGRPKFSRKQYDTPRHPWTEERIKTERELIKKYGLKNHKEVWKAKTKLRRFRAQARELLARTDAFNPQIKKESDQMLMYLMKIGALPVGSTLDDVLALETETILSRRLQTLVYLKGISTTISHARQLINHGHVAIGERKVTIPSYIVTKDEEPQIAYTAKSPLNEISHPARPKTDVYKTVKTPVEPTTPTEKPQQQTSPATPAEEKPPQPAPDISAETKPVLTATSETPPAQENEPETKPGDQQASKTNEPQNKDKKLIKKQEKNEGEQ